MANDDLREKVEQGALKILTEGKRTRALWSIMRTMLEIEKRINKKLQTMMNEIFSHMRTPPLKKMCRFLLMPIHQLKHKRNT